MDFYCLGMLPGPVLTLLLSAGSNFTAVSRLDFGSFHKSTWSVELNAKNSFTMVKRIFNIGCLTSLVWKSKTCTVWYKAIDLSKIGGGALKSHQKWKTKRPKHLVKSCISL